MTPAAPPPQRGPEGGHRDDARPEDARPEGAQPESRRPESSQPEDSRPEPLKDEIAKEARSSSRGAAQLEVRVRRAVLLLVVLIPVIWWIVSALR